MHTLCWDNIYFLPISHPHLIHPKVWHPRHSKGQTSSLKSWKNTHSIQRRLCNNLYILYDLYTWNVKSIWLEFEYYEVIQYRINSTKNEKSMEKQRIFQTLYSDIHNIQMNFFSVFSSFIFFIFWIKCTTSAWI